MVILSPYAAELDVFRNTVRELSENPSYQG